MSVKFTARNCNVYVSGLPEQRSIKVWFTVSYVGDLCTNATGAPYQALINIEDAAWLEAQMQLGYKPTTLEDVRRLCDYSRNAK